MFCDAHRLCQISSQIYKLQMRSYTFAASIVDYQFFFIQTLKHWRKWRGGCRIAENQGRRPRARMGFLRRGLAAPSSGREVCRSLCPLHSKRCEFPIGVWDGAITTQKFSTIFSSQDDTRNNIFDNIIIIDDHKKMKNSYPIQLLHLW